MQSRTTRTTSGEESAAELLKYNPLRFVREAYVRFIQGLFHKAPPGYYHWELDDEDTEIIVTDELPVKADSLNRRPCIACSRGPIAMRSLGLDDMAYYDQVTGAKKRAWNIVGNMTINCCSRVPLESEQLAYIVGEHLSVLREVLHKWGFFDVGRNISIGAPSPPGSIIQSDSADEWFVTPVTSPFQLGRMSKTIPLLAPVVGSIETTLNGSLSRLQAGFPYSNTVDLPYQIDRSYESSSEFREGSLAGRAPDTVPHPLNPAVSVRVRAVRAGDPAVRPPSIRGRTIPIIRVPVEESDDEQLRLQERVIKT